MVSIRAGLLALLASEPKQGYQLKTEFEAATGGVWKLNVGQVYTTLDRLGRDGCVAIDGGADQKRYAITAAGREELASWWAADPVDEPPPRDELVVKVLLAVATGGDRGLDVITRQRTALTELLQLRRRALRSTTDGSLVAQLAGEALLVRVESDLRWLGVCEARLLDHRATEGRRTKETKR